MTDVRPTGASQPMRALVPVEVVPVAQAPATAIIATTPSRLINRDTAAHGMLTLGTLVGGGAIAYLGTSTAGLVAMGAAALASIAFSASRLLGGGSGLLERQLLASLASERQSLSLAQDLIVRERAALEAERANVTTLAAKLAEQRMAPMVADLEAQRAALKRENEALQEQQTESRQALAREAAALTPDDIKAIAGAISAYVKTTNEGIHRFVGDVYTAGVATARQRALAAEKVLPALVGTGKVVAGTCTLDTSAPNKNYVVPAEGATVITSIAQLRLFLRLATGHPL